MSDKRLTLIDKENAKSLELEVLQGTYGAPVANISSLYRDLGYFTYDPGFVSTASCHSKITYIDGEQGILLYRGYPIEQLAKHSSFIEVAYLLLYSELPTVEELQTFRSEICHHTMINESLKTFFNGFHYDAHPMAMMVGVVGSLSAFYHDSTNIHDPDNRERSAHRLLAKMPTIAAASFKHNIGEPFIYPRNDVGYCANLLHMMFSVPSERCVPDELHIQALNLLFILHADHEQNASTSTVRLAGSSGANPYACIAAGITSLWGPAHGGANEAVLAMLNEIGDVSNIPKYIDRAKDKDDSFRLMGFGHRVYKHYDPRAAIIREVCHKVLHALGDDRDPLFELALKLEEIALEDEYFIERKM